MSYNKAIPPVSDGLEEPLGPDEILYSRTDARGVILAGNEAFRRLAGQGWDRLIGAPHRVLRSPDMPRGVFHLMWKTLQAGKPACTLFKNRSASGRWYWTLAVVLPVEGGHVSVQVKPAGALFQDSRAIYATLLAAEQTESLGPEEGAARFLALLAAAGFASPRDYMATLLRQVVTARGGTLRAADGAQMQAMATLGANIQATRKEQRALMAEFDALQSVPTNMRIIASRLEPSGGPISAISDNYKFASTEIARRLESFAGTEDNQCQVMADIMAEAILTGDAARLLADLAHRLEREEAGASPVDLGAELTLLAATERRSAEAAAAAIHRVGQVAGALNEASIEIRRMTLGLDTIRVMGKVESGHLGPGGDGLSSTIEQLDSRHAVIAGHLQRLMDLSAGIRAAIGTISRKHGPE